jgi:gliding motility-associated-like protein
MKCKNLMREGKPSLSDYRKLILLFFIFPFGLNVYSQSYPIDVYNGQTVNTCAGLFYDSGGSAGLYLDNENYTVTFCSDNGSPIRFDFLSFSVRSDDTLYIYDGPDTSAPLYGKYSGGTAPVSLNSSGTCLTFKFVSDPLFTRPGWEANISCCPPPATSPIIPSDPMSCAGSIVNYSVDMHAGSTYDWTVIHGTPASITGGTNNLDITWDETGDVTGYIKVVETNSCGSKDFSELLVDIYSLPVVNFTGLDAYYCIYSPPATLTGIPSGGIFSGPGIIGNTFTPSDAGAGTHTIFYDYLDPATGCTNQKAIETLVDVPVVFDVNASATSYCAGSGVSITLSGSEPGVNYQLKLNGADDGAAIPGTGSVLTWINKQQGVYTVVATNAITSCVNNMSGTQVVTENPLPVPSFTAQPGSNACSNIDVTYITQSGQSGYIWGIPGVPGIDYNITSGGGLTDNNVTLSWLTAGSKVVTINYTDANGCTATTATPSTATTVNITPPAPVGSPVQNFCSETSPVVADLIATGSGIQWYTASSGGSALLPSTPLTDATHYFASQTLNGCESTDRFEVTVQVASIPSAPAANAGTGATCSQITANWNASAGATSYRLDVSAVITFSSYIAGYQDLDVGDVTVYNISGLTAGNTYYYRVRAENYCGMSGNSATIVYATLPATPAVPGAISGTAVQCPGLTGQTYSISPVLDATTYTWIVPAGWTITSGQGTISVTVSTGVPGQNGNVTVTAGNICGTSAPNSLAVTVIPNASITSVIGASPLCIGETSDYTANGVVLSGGTGSWSSSNPAIASVSATGSVTGMSAGTCDIIYTISGGCGGTVSAQQPVTINPDASITSVTGTSPLCIGGTSVYTANGVVLSGGTGAWSSSNPAVAMVDAAGLVKGISAGSSDIIYTINGGCGGPVSAQQPVIINPNASIASVTGTSPLCIGGTSAYTANGVVLSGGTGSWSSSNPSVAIVDATGLVSGISAGSCNIIYTITGGCGGTVFAQQPVIINPDASIASVTGTSPLCIGGTTSYIANGVILGGGTGAWSSSNTSIATVDASGLVTGISAGPSDIIYTITGGCGGVATASATVDITSPPSATISYSGSPWCGSAGVQTVIFAGTPGGSYSAVPVGLSINSVTGEITPGTSLPGTYTVIYTMVSIECGIITATTPVTINQIPAIVITDPAAVCYPATVDLTDAAVTAGSTAGLAYSYWTDAAATIVYSSPGNAVAGTYYIKGTDLSGCYDIEPVTVTVNPIPAVSAIQTDVLCFGESNGSIDVIAAGGNGPYTYFWTGTGVVETDEDQNGLAAGLYSVVVTDANLCSSASFQVTITEPAALSGSITAQTDVSVNGGSDGSVTVDGSGGTSPYLYKLDAGSFQPSGTFGSLAAGSYTVTVQDFNLCSFDVSVTITEPPVGLSGSITSQTDVDCFGSSTGSVTVAGSGGVTPYDYKLDAGSYQLSGTFGSLAAGTYIVTVRDAVLSTFDVPVIITQPATALGGTTVVTNVSCFGEETGSVDLTVAGGTAPYTFLWSNGATTEDLADIIAGNYTVTITDANNCIANSAGNVSEPAESLTGTIVVSDVLCSGGATGSVDLTVTGGTAPYTFLWSNGATTEDLTNVVAGYYTVTITDANNCTAVSGGTVLEFIGTVVATDVLCYGGATGTLDLTVTGGTAPYTYLWSNDSTTEDLNGVAAGYYTVDITDASGCTVNSSGTVAEPSAALDGTAVVTDVICFGDATGSVDLTVSGGTAPYSFQWDNGTTTEDLTNVIAGDYVVTISDANSCTFVVPVTIIQPSEALAGSVTSQNNVTCYGLTNGSVTIAGAGGTAPYAYILNSGTLQSSGTFNDLGAANYTITVLDASLCTVTIPVTITEPSAISIVPTVNDASCPGEPDGSITLTITGGTQPFSVTWLDDTGILTFNRLNIPAGTYSVIITDVNGCSSSIDIVVEFTGTGTCIEIPQVITPNNDGYNDTWKIKNIDLFPNAEVFVFTRWGKLVFRTKNIPANEWDGTFNGKLLPTDSYHYVLHLNDGSKPRSGAISIIR